MSEKIYNIIAVEESPHDCREYIAGSCIVKEYAEKLALELAKGLKNVTRTYVKEAEDEQKCLYLVTAIRSSKQNGRTVEKPRICGASLTEADAEVLCKEIATSEDHYNITRAFVQAFELDQREDSMGNEDYSICTYNSKGKKIKD